MLWCVCSVLDLRRLHNEVTNSVRHLPIICFWTGAWMATWNQLVEKIMGNDQSERL